MKQNPIAFIIVLLIVVGILGSSHFFIYKSVIRFFSLSNPSLLFYLQWLMVFLGLSFLAATFIGMKYYGLVTRIFYTFSASWLGTAYWLCIAAIVAWVAYALAKLIIPGFNINSVGAACLIIGFLTSMYGIWNSYQTKVRYMDVALDKLPLQWNGRKAVVVADTHLGNFHSKAFAKKITNLINAQNPDIILFAGDAYDGTPADFLALSGPFKNLKAAQGIYFAAGNHEEFGDSAPFLDSLKADGMHILDNRLEVVDGLQIAGIGYKDGVKANREQSVLEAMNINTGSAAILIKHSPTNIGVAEKAGFGLQVSGHTHVGQMWPFNYLTKRIFGQFYYGLSRLDTIQVYTTSGAGTWGPPQRVGTSPEIAVITLVNK